MTPADRVKQIRSRARIRNWEFRQRHLARGAWARFRFALAEARAAYAIDESDLATVLDEGFRTDDRGMGLLPQKQLVWVSAQRAQHFATGRALEMRLDAAMLGAEIIALVPFDEEMPSKHGADWPDRTA